MMAQKSAEKWKMKKWFEVYSPKVFGEASIGEIPADEEEKALGRIIEVNMSWLTHKPEHSFLSVGLRVTDAKNNAAHTELEFMEQMFSYTHSLVRRHSSVIYTVDKFADKEGKPVVVKLIAVSFSKLATPKKSQIRKKLQEYCKEYISGKNKDEIIKGVMDNSLQSGARDAVKNITRMAKLEVRKLEF
jgi:small subunit ribosomal protein S3Ae